MFGRIYLKLYVAFLVIFLLTTLTVVALSSAFYALKVKDEVEGFWIAQARLMEDDYEQSCTRSVSDCLRRFFRDVGHSGLLHLWVLNPDGGVIRSTEHRPPSISTGDMRQAASGEIVTSLGRNRIPQVILPMKDQTGSVRSILVLERTYLRGHHFPRFPLTFSLLIAGGVAALLVLPLALRISHPIRELHRLGEEWAEGHLEKRASVKGKDEIADLAAVFNTMAGNLQTMLQQRKEFLALISHELKSPMTRMKLALELLSEKGSDPSLIQSMQSDISESEKLVEQLLVLSRLEMEIPTTNFEPVDVSAVMERAIEQINPQARSARVTIEFTPSSHSLVVKGDAEQLQRAFANVLENGVKFSPAGSNVDVQIESLSPSIRIRISDQGSGLLPAEQEKIFEPFYRSKSAKEKEGSGLGLFIARRIVESHSGKISASANQPAGTVLTIDLPAQGSPS